jgi:response regulator RpfG family c-di-GMP phosphodiesterase
VGNPGFPQHLCAKKASYQKGIVEEEINILCVDDEQNVLNAITRLMLDENYTVLNARSGKEGLEINHITHHLNNTKES